MKKLKEKILLIVVNEDRFFLSHRLEVGCAALSEGWSVKIVAKPTGRESEITEKGMEFIPMPLAPTKVNALSEIKVIRFLTSLYREHPNAVVHHVGMKLITLGSVAVKLAGGMRGVVNAVSGLGIFFQNPYGMKQRALLRMLRFFQPEKYVRTIFQNHDDESIFEGAGLVNDSNKVFIKGSGVDLQKYSFTEIPAVVKEEKRVVVFTGRLLRSKGVEDFVAAAELLRKKWEGKVEFWICGGLSGNSDGLTQGEMMLLTDNSYIKWGGQRNDIQRILQRSSIMVLPSYYREGLPKSLIEASAVGRPIVTCDSVGCRDTVENGRNGFLVEPHNPAQIASCIDELLSNPTLCRQMGRESRRIAERDYDVRNVVKRHLALYEELAVS